MLNFVAETPHILDASFLLPNFSLGCSPPQKNETDCVRCWYVFMLWTITTWYSTANCTSTGLRQESALWPRYELDLWPWKPSQQCALWWQVSSKFFPSNKYREMTSREIVVNGPMDGLKAQCLCRLLLAEVQKLEIRTTGSLALCL